MKIGLLGGTFDPIHNGHIMLGKKALSKFKLDKVVFLPAGTPYFKINDRVISLPIHRENMTRLAILGEENLDISTMELYKDGYTYTAETLTQLTNEHPENEYYFILGADSFIYISTWNMPEVIFEKATIIVAGRPDQVSDKTFDAEIKRLKKKYGAKILKLNWKGVKASSTDIRKKTSKDNYKVNVPESVRKYIWVTGLYKQKLSNKEIKARLSIELKPSRYVHSLGVAETAKDLAICHGYKKPKKAYKTGLLHDCGKPYADALGHASKGAEIAKKYYHINDEEILSAIACHTVGKIGMSLLDKIIYVADFIEPSRADFPELSEIRETAYMDLDKALLMCMESTQIYLKNQGKSIDESSLKVYTYYKNLNSEETHV